MSIFILSQELGFVVPEEEGSEDMIWLLGNRKKILWLPTTVFTESKYLLTLLSCQRLWALYFNVYTHAACYTPR